MKRLKIWAARCKRCGEEFEYIPGLVCSTKEDALPRCPTCDSYRNTVTIGPVDRSNEGKK